MLFKSWDPPKWWNSKNPYNESISEKNNMAFNDRLKKIQMQSTPYNLKFLGKSKNVPVIGSLKQITKNNERGMGEEYKFHFKGSKEI